MTVEQTSSPTVFLKKDAIQTLELLFLQKTQLIMLRFSMEPLNQERFWLD